MLPRPYRADRRLLENVYSPQGHECFRRESRRGVFCALNVFTPRAANDDFSHFAFVISAKAAKKAVDRNRVKRRARAIVAKVLPTLPRGRVFIFNFNKEVVTASFSELERDILSVLAVSKKE